MRKLLILALCGSLLAGCAVQHEYTSYTPPVTPTSKAQIIGMVQAGYSDATIVDVIQTNGIDRRPSADDLIEMKRAGVSSWVLNTALEAPITYTQSARETRTVIVRDYPPDPLFLFGTGAFIGYLLGRH